MRGVVSAIPGAEGWVVGPEEEDRAYAAECRVWSPASDWKAR